MVRVLNIMCFYLGIFCVSDALRYAPSVEPSVLHVSLSLAAAAVLLGFFAGGVLHDRT